MEKLRVSTGEWIRQVLNEKYSSLEPDEGAKAVAFYGSPGGQVFRAFRELVLAETAYGLPYVIETEPRAALKKRLEDARERREGDVWIVGAPVRSTAAQRAAARAAAPTRRRGWW